MLAMEGGSDYCFLSLVVHPEGGIWPGLGCVDRSERAKSHPITAHHEGVNLTMFCGHGSSKAWPSCQSSISSSERKQDSRACVNPSTWD
jgi:hypothetical protein